MPHYPSDSPSKKHDLLSPIWPLPPDISASDLFLPTKESILECVSATDPQSNKNLQLISSCYSYPDGPGGEGIDDCNPLSRNMFLIGFASRDTAESMISLMYKCTVAVKRAGGHYRSNLSDRDKRSSDNFHILLSTLKKGNYVTVLGVDSSKRFLMIDPGEGNEFAGDVCYGFLSDVKSRLEEDDQQDDGPTWNPPDDNETDNKMDTTAEVLWQPETTNDESSGLWQPDATATDGTTTDFWQPPADASGDAFSTAPDISTTDWSAATTAQQADEEQTSNGNKRPSPSSPSNESTFHNNTAAAAADQFYSNLTRDLSSRADSRLFHMRSFNGWVKATQIAELNPKCKNESGTKKLRILDLACGKGGDLGKWTMHPRGIENYVGADVARGSLKDAAIRIMKIVKRSPNKLRLASLICADLGQDVLSRAKDRMLTWKYGMGMDTDIDTDDPPFESLPGGGVSKTDRFDVVSIQFAIHYMMSTHKRARRFFKTVGDLLEVGGNLVLTTIDARVVLEKLMGLGLDFETLGDDEDVTVITGEGKCRLRFKGEIVKRIVNGHANDQNAFGLEYYFSLTEGDDHAKGVGQAVDLAEWLTPVPLMERLAKEAGLELEAFENFHEFYTNRKMQSHYPSAHRALYNMHVLDRGGSISADEWSVSRMYVAVKFVKVRNCDMVLEGDDDEEEEEQKPVKKFNLMEGMKRAKKSVGNDVWNSLSAVQKTELAQKESINM